ncbi:MAG: tRNA pseudouridine(38-40) synthase TruA [Spirochaetia bacterium]
MPRRNLKLIIAYDGTDFVGWQVQRTGRTVQGVIQNALESMHGFPVTVYVAGRTDSGVHADGQVINFRTTIDSIPSPEYHIALNASLPRDVRAVMSTEVPDSFHARYSAIRRVYRYYYTLSDVLHPRRRTFAVRLRRRPCLRRLNRLSAPLIGSHDFTTFTLPRETSRSRVREVHSAGFFPLNGQLVFEISANGFLWRMVRSIVGTLLELDRHQAGPDEMVRRLNARNRTEAGPTAPSAALVLHYVEYPDQQLHE